MNCIKKSATSTASPNTFECLFIWSLYLRIFHLIVFLSIYGAKLRKYDPDTQNIFPVFTPVFYNTEDTVHITVATVLGVRVTHNIAYEHSKITHRIFHTCKSPSVSHGIFWACLKFEDIISIPSVFLLCSRSYVVLVLSLPLKYIIDLFSLQLINELQNLQEINIFYYSVSHYKYHMLKRELIGAFVFCFTSYKKVSYPHQALSYVQDVSENGAAF
jgi:hypothetical protein